MFLVFCSKTSKIFFYFFQKKFSAKHFLAVKSFEKKSQKRFITEIVRKKPLFIVCRQYRDRNLGPDPRLRLKVQASLDPIGAQWAQWRQKMNGVKNIKNVFLALKFLKSQTKIVLYDQNSVL